MALSYHFLDEVNRRLALPTPRKSLLAPYFDAVRTLQPPYYSPSPSPSRSPSPEPLAYAASFQSSWPVRRNGKRSLSAALGGDCCDASTLLSSPKRRKIASATGVSRGVSNHKHGHNQRTTMSTPRHAHYSNIMKTSKTDRSVKDVLRPRSPNNSIRRATALHRSTSTKLAQLQAATNTSLTYNRATSQQYLRRSGSLSSGVQTKSRYTLRRTPARTKNMHRSAWRGS